MTEVSIDGALSVASTKLSADTTEILDELIVQAVELHQEDPLTPLDAQICQQISQYLPSLSLRIKISF